jgi:hypothetical protein
MNDAEVDEAVARRRNRKFDTFLAGPAFEKSFRSARFEVFWC